MQTNADANEHYEAAILAEAEAGYDNGESDEVEDKPKRRSRRTRKARSDPEEAEEAEEEETEQHEHGNFPASVRAAIDVYADNIGEVKAMSKALSKKRKKTTDAAKIIKEFMNEADVDIVRVGRSVFRRKAKTHFKCDSKRFEMSTMIPERLKNQFIRANTITEPTFQVK
jgi:hypothetical protein